MMAALISASAFEAYRVAIWLAPDACLMAGCALSLLGLYRGYSAPTSVRKLWWYTVMHVGALMGFMAKSACRLVGARSGPDSIDRLGAVAGAS